MEELRGIKDEKEEEGINKNFGKQVQNLSDRGFRGTASP
jgi:hypothetical protein